MMQPQFEDATLECVVCNTEFIWTAGEQSFICGLAAEGKLNRDGSPIVVTEPKRCPPCRRAKKERMDKRMNKSI